MTHPGYNPFAVFGLPVEFALDRALLELRYRELQKVVHPDRAVSLPAGERTMMLSHAVSVNEAYRVLRDDVQRAEALLRVKGMLAESASPASQEFLMEMLELREELAAVRHDSAQLNNLVVRAQKHVDEAKGLLEQSLSAESFAAATEALARLRYFVRFADEVDSALAGLDEVA